MKNGNRPYYYDRGFWIFSVIVAAIAAAVYGLIESVKAIDHLW